MIHDAQQQKKKVYTDNGMKWQPEVIEWWYGVQPLAKKASKKRKKKKIQEREMLVNNSQRVTKRILEYSRYLHQKENIKQSTR